MMWQKCIEHTATQKMSKAYKLDIIAIIIIIVIIVYI